MGTPLVRNRFVHPLVAYCCLCSCLGHFAVKRIAVGESHSYLLNILREVRLLERLIHPNIITYQFVLTFLVFLVLV